MTTLGGAVPLDIALTFAVWIEVFLYGIYTCLFASAIPSMMKRGRSQRASSPAWVFLTTNVIMYIVASLHIVLMFYRFIRAYIAVGHPTIGVEYLFNTLKWENILNNIILCTMAWLGDCLVIYRCYYVWDCNFWVISVPLALVLATIGTNSYILYWFTHPYDPNLDFKALLPLLNSIYPMAFVQNFLTTSLISFKIWQQHRMSVAAGIVDRGSRLSLIHVFRIVVESAMVYTLQIFILIILYFRYDNVQYIFQAASVPSIGIVFVLIAFRVHLARNKTMLGTGTGTEPHWVNQNSIPVELSARGSSSTRIVGPRSMTFAVRGAVNSLENQYIHHEDSEPFPRSSYNHKGDIGDEV